MKKYQFKLDFNVRDHECDFQGIVSNAYYLNYLQHTRHQFFKSIGINPIDLKNRGIFLVVTKVEIDYKKSLKSGDSFWVGLNLGRVSKLRFAFYNEIFNSLSEALILKATIVGTSLNDKGRPFFPPEIEHILESAAK